MKQAKKKARTRKTCGEKTRRKIVKKMGPRSEKERRKLRNRILRHPAFKHLDPANRTDSDAQS